MDYIYNNIRPCKGRIDYKEPDGCFFDDVCGIKDNDVEYITKEEAFSAVDRRIKELKRHPAFVRKGHPAIIDIVGVKKHIAELPNADVVPVAHGKWIGDCKAISDADGIARCSMYGFRCSKCNGFSIEDGRYCPQCGAKMDGGDK